MRWEWIIYCSCVRKSVLTPSEYPVRIITCSQIFVFSLFISIISLFYLHFPWTGYSHKVQKCNSFSSDVCASRGEARFGQRSLCLVFAVQGADSSLSQHQCAKASALFPSPSSSPSFHSHKSMEKTIAWTSPGSLSVEMNHRTGGSVHPWVRLCVVFLEGLYSKQAEDVHRTSQNQHSHRLNCRAVWEPF